VSFAALAAMYKLWWERERVEYSGQPQIEQRQEVFQNAGIVVSLLAEFNSLEKHILTVLNWSTNNTNRYTTTKVL